MTNMYVRHTVKDYATWKAAFDGNNAARKAAGSRGGVVFRGAENPNQITVILEWDNLANAQRFSQSDELRDVMQGAGVISPPDVQYLNEADRTAN